MPEHICSYKGCNRPTYVSLVQVLLTATLATLFIFSVRRRFKHTE